MLWLTDDAYALISNNCPRGQDGLIDVPHSGIIVAGEIPLLRVLLKMALEDAGFDVVNYVKGESLSNIFNNVIYKCFFKIKIISLLSSILVTTLKLFVIIFLIYILFQVEYLTILVNKVT